MKNELPIKQQRFADKYIETGNATQSYIDAGYSATTRKVAEGNSKKLLGKNSVQQYIKDRMQELKKDTIASQQDVLEFLTSVMNGVEKDAFGLDPSLQDRIRCAELLGKRYGSFVEKKEINGAIPVIISGEDALEE